MNLEEDDIKFQGQIANPTAAQMKPPLLILIYLGKRAVMSVPAERELAEILVPTWAMVKQKARMNTPPRSPLELPSKNFERTSNGFQKVSLYRYVEALETRTPIKHVMEKQIGRVINCDQIAAFGLLANLEKSGALTIKVEKLAKAFMTELMNAQANADPETLLGS